MLNFVGIAFSYQLLCFRFLGDDKVTSDNLENLICMLVKIRAPYFKFEIFLTLYSLLILFILFIGFLFWRFNYVCLIQTIITKNCSILMNAAVFLFSRFV